MRRGKIKALLMASVMIMLCSVMVVGGTYALWSDSVKVNTHLSAGTLKVELTRTYLEKYTLNDNMYMEKTTDAEEETNMENFFGIGANEKIVPTSYYAAKLKLENKGSVAIKYTVQIKAKDGSAQELAKQIKVYIGQGEADNVTYTESEFLMSGNNESTTIIVASGEMDKTKSTTEFWVKVQFEDGKNNNDAQNKSVNFDLLVTATQKTGN